MTTRPRPLVWLRGHPRATDTVLALVVGALSVVVHLTTDQGGYRDADSLGALLVFVSCLPIAVRRASPIGALIGAVAVELLVGIADYSGTGLGAMITLYTVGAYVQPGGRRATVLIVTGVIVVAFLGGGLLVDELAWGDAIGTAVIFPGVFLLGDNIRRRRERVAELAARAERAERERELLARERVGEERNRIARELHDVVAHSVSVMVIQAGAARRQLNLDVDRAADALSTIELTGRQAMQEMRRILGVLRDSNEGSSDGLELAPQPSLEGIDGLLASDPTLPTALVVEGTPVAVPPGVELSAYRVVQEALTNVRKHAGRCAAVQVAMRYASDALEVEVLDDGHGAAAPQHDDLGLGLVGMRERVAACGGELRVGPAVGGGWRVRARFPLGTDGFPR